MTHISYQIELKCKDGSKVAVSVWLTNTEDNAGNSLYVAVIEPVQRVVSYLLLDEFGLIMAADETSTSLFHCSEEDFVGHNIIKWIPNIIWPASSDDLDQVCLYSCKYHSTYFVIVVKFAGEKNSENNRF